jgi:hypothetical protein
LLTPPLGKTPCKSKRISDGSPQGGSVLYGSGGLASFGDMLCIALEPAALSDPTAVQQGPCVNGWLKISLPGWLDRCYHLAMEGATQRVASAFLTWLETNLAFRFEASMDMLFKSLADGFVLLGRIFALRSSGAQGGCDYFGVKLAVINGGWSNPFWQWFRGTWVGELSHKG